MMSRPLSAGPARWLSLAAMAVSILTASIQAAEETPPTQTTAAKPVQASDEDAIRATVQSYVEAYNKGDAQAVANHWGETAEWVSPSGERFQGRQAIQRAMEALFAASAGVQIKVVEPSVRLLTPDTALEEGTVRVIAPDQAPSDSQYLAIHAKKNGQWKLQCVRETALSEPAPEQPLKALEWMVGEWIDESPDTVVEHRCRWSEDGHYLLGEFVVQWQGRPALKGDLRIGWDPLTQQIKSWLFDSEGGYAEGLWTRIDDRWVVKLTGVRADGSTASATNMYVPLRRDQYQYISLDRVVAGQVEPDQVVRIVRRPPQPQVP